MRAITYGSEPMSQGTLSRARAVFPNVTLKQTYGLIELGVFKTKSKSDDSLLIKIDPEDCKTRIKDGMLELKTETAMLGYLNAESPFTEDGWFKTGDVVEVDGEYLRILGRNSEIINVGGEKVYPVEVEESILAFSNVEDVVVYKEPHPLIGNIVCAKVRLLASLDSPEKEKEFILSLKKHCNETLARFKVPAKISLTTEPLAGLRQKKIRMQQ